MTEQRTLFDLDLVPPGYSSGFLQLISENFVFYLIEKVIGKPLNEEAKAQLYGVRTVEEVMKRLTESNLQEYLFLSADNTTSKGRLGEFYVSLRVEQTPSVANQPGYDLLGHFVDGDKAGIGRVQVKTAGPDNNSKWGFQITNKRGEVNYDVLVAIGLRDNNNPCKADIFVIPSRKLVEIAKGSSISSVHINISKSRFHWRSRTKLNNYWQYHLPSHNQLTRRIAELVCKGNFVILSSYAK